MWVSGSGEPSLILSVSRGIVDAFKRQPSVCHILGSPNLGGKVDSLPGRQADYL